MFTRLHIHGWKKQEKSDLIYSIGFNDNFNYFYDTPSFFILNIDRFQYQQNKLNQLYQIILNKKSKFQNIELTYFKRDDFPIYIDKNSIPIQIYCLNKKLFLNIQPIIFSFKNFETIIKEYLKQKLMLISKIKNFQIINGMNQYQIQNTLINKNFNDLNDIEYILKQFSQQNCCDVQICKKYLKANIFPPNLFFNETLRTIKFWKLTYFYSFKQFEKIEK